MKFLETAPTAVVIPVHGGLSLTVQCLDSLRDCDPLPIMVVVVDDGSPDDTAAHLATHYPDVHVVRGDGNLWWGGAINAGCNYAMEAGAGTLILLNNDNVSLSRNLLTELVRLVEERGGCVSATLLMETPDGLLKILAAGGTLDWRRGGTELRHSGGPFEESGSVSECDWLPGMALAFTAKSFRVLGGIDSRAFPQSRGDADFTLRARRCGYACSVSTRCWIVNDRTQVPFGFERRLSFADFFRGLVIRNSNYQLRTALLFFLRHCPARWLLPSLASFYARYLYAWLKTQRMPRSTKGVGVNAPIAGIADAPLRLAFVLWSGTIGGAETFVAALARVLRASEVDARVVVLTQAEPLAQRLRQAGIPFSELGLKRGRAALWHPRLLADAVRGAGQDGAILVAGGFLALALRLGRYRGRIVAVEHGALLQTHPAHRRPWLVDRLDAFLGARAVDVHVAVSSFLRDRMRSSPRPIVTIPNGVDLDVYRPSAPLEEDAFVIGCMSRLAPGKGVEDVLAAAQPAILGGARLRIAGDGPMRSELQQLADRLGIRVGASFEGWIGDAADVAAFWHGCDVAITAPNDWVESFGLVAVEAMACGRPVVATRGGALAETVVHGRTGFLTEPRDTNALATALLAYMEDEALLATHGAAARSWCEQQFDIRRCAADYVGLFRRHPDRASCRAVDDAPNPALPISHDERLAFRAVLPREEMHRGCGSERRVG